MPAKQHTSKNNERILATVMFVAGAVILAVAAGLITLDPQSVHAPRWVIGLIGLVFLSGGIAVVAPAGNGIVRRLAAATIVIGMGAASAWVALFGSGDHMSGGLWFLPHYINVGIGRVMFGLGALMCFAIAAWALFGKHDERSKTPSD